MIYVKTRKALLWHKLSRADGTFIWTKCGHHFLQEGDNETTQSLNEFQRTKKCSVCFKFHKN